MNETIEALHEELSDERARLAEAHQRVQLAEMALSRAQRAVLASNNSISRIKLDLHIAQEAEEPEV